jgi:hypothetical protein
VQGYVWRVPRVNGKIVAKGTRAQVDALLEFVRRLQRFGFIQTFIVENPERAVLIRSFDILSSSSKHVLTGQCSDETLDDVVSTSSAGLPMSRRTTSPHSHD